MALVLLAWAGILLSPALYGDDALRVYTHTSINQHVHGRPLADAIYSLLSGGMYVDIAPLGQVFALALLLVAGVLVARAFVSRESFAGTWLPVLFAVLPLYYAGICYRYDSLHFGVAIACAGLAFYLCSGKIAWWRVLLAGAALFCTLATYQPMAGMYFCACAALFAHNVLREDLKPLLRRVGSQMLAVLLAAVAYLPVYLQAKRAAQP